RMKQMAAAVPLAVAVSQAPPEGGAGADSDACTLDSSPEHARADGGEACDDGRAG
ncbi:MAG: hypothetical protein JEZ11_27785, partial [Desulfobacterales bacterium]|nr:hypothetical protein [Desulfobacterales bacterium]